MTAREAEIIELIRKEVKPALGCTEPIAVALAVAKAMEILEDRCEIPDTDWRMKECYRLRIEVSGNILKNGMGVGIPGTGMVGLHIAAALGAVCGKSEYGLEVLNDLNDVSITRAKEMVENRSVNIVLAETSHKLYVKAHADFKDGSTAYALIQDNHDSIVETCFNGEILSSVENDGNQETPDQKTTLDYKLTVKEIVDFASTVAYEDIEFILESRTLNLALAKEGMKGCYGLKVGWAINLDDNREVFGGDFLSYAMSLTAAASDARMAGCTLAAMSNSGSGNQGITVTMPVIAYSITYGTNDEKLARALVLSHLIAIHIKGYLGKLSALCGCVIASTGSACGLVYLRGGDYEQICSAIKNMIGNITGMVCDGAKSSCAAKIASCVDAAIMGYKMALRGDCYQNGEGLVKSSLDATIKTIMNMGREGMHATDQVILDLMLQD